MNSEKKPVYHRPSFWIGSIVTFFGLMLWAYPELLSLLVGGFFVLVGVGILSRAFSKRDSWSAW